MSDLSRIADMLEEESKKLEDEWEKAYILRMANAIRNRIEPMIFPYYQPWNSVLFYVPPMKSPNPTYYF